MSRALIIIRNEADRDKACVLAGQVPVGTRIEFKATRRSIPQNSLMWDMLTDVSKQLKWHGQKLRAVDWKLIFIDALKRERRLVPSIEGDGFVNLSTSSSDLSKGEMSELIDLIAAFGANHGVQFAKA